ncbi:MAG: metallophosphoesterase family protein [Actinomycetota bacterium]
MESRPTRRRRALTQLRLAVFAVVGASVALLAAGDVGAAVGPFDTTVSARPSLAGFTVVRLAPLGSIELDTHDAPINLELRVDELRLDEAERIGRDPSVLRTLEDDIADDAREALLLVAFRALVVAVIGGAAAVALASPRLRSVGFGAAAGGAFVIALGTATAISFDANAVAEPQYSGLLTVASTAVGDVEDVLERFDDYQAQLTDLVGNVVTLYSTVQGLPTFAPDDRMVRVLHVSDIHLNPQAFELMELLVDQFQLDAIADTGDLTDWGTEPESQLVDRIGRMDVPYVWVRGNHDSATTQRAVARQPNAVVLDADPVTVAGLRFWGMPDRRYTPRKDRPTGRDVERDEAEAVAPAVARRLASDEPPGIDVVLVHDARMAQELGGAVPLVLAGHNHEPRQDSIGSTTLLLEGSTGGAGLRGLRGEAPEPLTCTVLYFDPVTDALVAYDRITVRGLGQSGARIERHVVGRSATEEQ